MIFASQNCPLRPQNCGWLRAWRDDLAVTSSGEITHHSHVYRYDNILVKCGQRLRPNTASQYAQARRLLKPLTDYSCFSLPIMCLGLEEETDFIS